MTVAFYLGSDILIVINYESLIMYDFVCDTFCLLRVAFFFIFLLTLAILVGIEIFMLYKGSTLFRNILIQNSVLLVLSIVMGLLITLDVIDTVSQLQVFLYFAYAVTLINLIHIFRVIKLVKSKK